MTTRAQRENLITTHDVGIVFAGVLPIWRKMYSTRPMPEAFPTRLRQSVMGYIEEASGLSAGETAEYLRRIYRQLAEAIEKGNLTQAASVRDAIPGAVIAKLERASPHVIESSGDIRNPIFGLDAAKSLLGAMVRGAELVPGRRRAGGKRSRLTVRVTPRFRQGRGYPPQEAEMWLVRFLADDFRYVTKGQEPRIWRRYPSMMPQEPFVALVEEVLKRCGVRGIYTHNLISRYCRAIRKCGCH